MRIFWVTVLLSVSCAGGVAAQPAQQGEQAGPQATQTDAQQATEAPAAEPQQGSPLAPVANLTEDWALWRWQMLAGDDALQLGLPAVAEGLYRRVKAGQDDVNDDTRRLLGLRISSALLAQRKFAEAEQALNNTPGQPDTPPFRVRRAIIAYSRGDIAQATAFLNGIDPEELSRADKPWYYLLHGMVARGRGDLEAAGPFLQQAYELALTPAQKAQIEAIMLRGDIASGQADARTAELLQKQMEQNRGTRAGFDFARQYAVVLDSLGRKDQAIDVLRAQLPLVTPLERDEAGQILLVMGLIAGEGTARGQLAFRDILEGKGSENYQKLALYLMASGAGVSEERDVKRDFRELLDRLIADSRRGYGDELLLLRARLALADGALARADADAAQVLERYPDSPLRQQALWLRAYAAWHEGRFRTAADYLRQVRELLSPGAERTRVGEVMGDAYFLNRDYTTAANIYTALLREDRTYTERGPIVYQAVLADTLSGNFESAQKLLDSEAPLLEADFVHRWRAEWNLIDQMRLSGQSAEALERLRRAFLPFERERLPADLRQRVLWQEARLALDVGESETAVTLADAILDSEPAPEPLVASYTLLLKARGLIIEKQMAQAQAVLEQLRKDYPGSDPAILSYLEEAHYVADEFRLSDAQRRLREAADTYRDSQHAPTALYEAAVLADKQGQDSTRREALSILRDLIERYPAHPLVFQARLLQGNIARELGEFGVAQDVYEALLRDFSNNPEIYLAELYRANTLLARSASDPTLLDESAAGLERLLDLPNVPVDARVEAGYTLGQILVQEKQFARARETLWLVVSRYLIDPAQSAQLGAKGRYWMSRSLLELGDLLDREGKADDASRVYTLISDYQLPGQNLASARLEKLGSAVTPLR